MRAIFDAGVRIPQDLAIVGCGNFGYDDLLRIPLTSIDEDSEGLGLNAEKLAIGLTKPRPTASLKNLLMRLKLVGRFSSKR